MQLLNQRLRRGAQAAGLFLSVALCQPANATVITLDTTDSSPSVGDNFTLTIGAQSRSDIISAFDLSLNYDDSRFGWVGTSFTDALGLSWDYEYNGADSINFGSLSLLTDDELSLWQFSDALVLAEVTFTALTAGTSGFTLSSNELVGSLGELLTPTLPDTLFVSVSGPSQQVPAPPTFALMILISVVLCLRKTIKEARS